MQSLYKDTSPRERNTSPTTRRKNTLSCLLILLLLSSRVFTSITGHNHEMGLTGSSDVNFISSVPADTIGLRLNYNLFSTKEYYNLFMNGASTNSNYRFVISNKLGQRLAGYNYLASTPFYGVGYAGYTIFLTSTTTSYRLTMSESAGTFALSYITSNSLAYPQFTGPVQDYPYTNYIYLTYIDASVPRWYKYDMLTGSHIVNDFDGYTNKFFVYGHDYDENLVMYYNTGGIAALRRKSNCYRQVDYSIPSGYSITHAKIHRANGYLQAVLPGSGKTGIYNLVASTGSTLVLHSQYPYTFHIVSCLGAFNYVALLSTTTSSHNLVSSFDHSVIALSLSCYSYPDALYSSPDATCIGNGGTSYTCYLLKVYGSFISSINVVSFTISGESPVSSVANCYSFSISDSAYCETCNSGYGLRRTNYCVQFSPLIGEGLNTGTGWIVPCYQSQCELCANNYFVCTKCISGTSPQTYLYSGTCYPLSSLPSGVGISSNISPYTAAACYMSNCKDCRSNYNTCITCLTTPQQYYLYNNACYLLASLPNGIGANTITNTGVNCNMSNCKNCQANYQTCSACVTSPQYYLYNNQCYLPTSLPAGIGANTATLGGQACSTTNCISCQNNYLTCNTCQSSPQYYLYNNACYLPASLPAGIGANLATLVGQTCSTTNCINCQADYQTCTACPTSPQQYLYNNQCYLPASLPVSVGPNLSTLAGVPCSDPKCSDCKSTYLTCTLCLGPELPQYYLHSGTCKLPTALPDGTGANTITMGTAPCSNANCQRCQDNYLKCTLCKTTPTTYLYADSCYYSWDLPKDFGANLVTKGVQTCSDPYCADCRDNFSICVQCSPTASPTRALYNGNCLLASSIPTGLGLDSTNSTKLAIAPCTNTFCNNCVSDVNTCTACSPNLPTIYVLYNSGCVLPTALPSKFGPNLSTFTSVSCSDTNCDNCKTDYRVCTACLSPSYYLYANQCITSASVPAQMGINTSTRKIVSCQDIKCQTCTADYTVCTQCMNDNNSADQTYLYNGSCYLRNQLPTGYGANTATKTAVSCSDTFCQVCTTVDYTKCDKCKSGTTPQKVLQGTACVDPTTLPTLTGADLAALVARSCADLQCQECKADYTKCTACKTGTPQHYLHDSRCSLPSALPYGFGANSATLTSAACTVAQCQNCQTNYQSCLNCKMATSPSPQYFMWNGNCILPSSFPAGAGSNLVTLAGDQCTDPQCEDCKLRIDVCVKCKTNSPQYFAMGGSCVLPAAFPSGYGADTPNRNMLSCQDTSCDNCRNNYAVCLACKVSFPQKFASGGTCKLPSALSAGEGGNYPTKATSNCLIADCEDCRDDYMKCTKCKVAATASMQTYLFNSNCLLISSIPIGYGADSSSRLVLPCVEKQCGDCISNPTVCVACRTSLDPSTQTFLYNTHCVLASELPAGTGANLSNRKTAPCDNPNCQDCSKDYTTCLKCKTATPPAPQLYLYRGTCIDLANVPSGNGADSVTKVIYPCNSPTCYDCKENFRECVKCKVSLSISTQTYLYASACYLSTDLPPGIGPNLANNLASPCPTNCRQCKNTHTKCTICYQQPSIYYQHNGQCLTLFGLPAGLGAGPAPDYQAMPCIDAGCMDCKANYEQCLICKFSPTIYYLHIPNNRCYTADQIPDGYGLIIKGTRGETQSCFTPGCSQCQKNYMLCTKCQVTVPPLYLHRATCTLAKYLPDYMGGNPDTMTSKKCAVDNCIDCKENFRICNKCANSKGRQLFLHTSSNSCLLTSSFPPGFGPDMLIKAIKPCAVQNCINCQTNYNYCLACDSKKGYFVNNNICERATQISFVSLPSSMQIIPDRIFFEAIFSQPLDSLHKDNLHQFINANLLLQIDVVGLHSGIVTKVRYHTFITHSVLFLSVQVSKPIYDSSLSISIQESPSIQTLIDGKYYGFMAIESKGDMTRIEDTRPDTVYWWIKYITYYATSLSTLSGVMIMGGLLALDPTGTFFRFTKILQIVNKLYFININYGKRLEAFLKLSR
jgi:hypothetical protein